MATLMESLTSLATSFAPESKYNGTANKDAPTDKLPSTGSPHLKRCLNLFAAVNNRKEDVTINGRSLHISDIIAIARHQSSIVFDESAKGAVDRAVQFLEANLGHISIYGVNTGFGASADTRTDDSVALQAALLQMQHYGVLPVPGYSSSTLSVVAPDSNIMPEAWVRAAMVIRLNSLLSGHSGVRWEILDCLQSLVNANICPVIPLRGSISASGDLSPLSYIAGTLIGQATILAYDGPASGRKIISSAEALRNHGLEPTKLQAKEALSLINGTAVSCGVGALAIYDSMHLAVLAQALTAMGVEASHGSIESFEHFISQVRPHPGQAEVARNIQRLLSTSQLVTKGEVEELDFNSRHNRQDRYTFRTAPQWLGPQLEDMLLSLQQIEIECSSTTDNPLIDPGNGEKGRFYHGGNFQAMAVTSAMEKIRQGLQNIGKLMFEQCTEIINEVPGLPANLAFDDPSISYTMKGVDIGVASYCSELGVLAAPVTSHVQKAENGNQAVNSLALISARQTCTANHVLSMLMSSYLYALCQALDLQVMVKEFETVIRTVISNATKKHLKFLGDKTTEINKLVFVKTMERFAETKGLDLEQKFRDVFIYVTGHLSASLGDFEAQDNAMKNVNDWRNYLIQRSVIIWQGLRKQCLKDTAYAAPYLGRTRPLYEFVRMSLDIRTHAGNPTVKVKGPENSTPAVELVHWQDLDLDMNRDQGYFSTPDTPIIGNGITLEHPTIGESISKIYQSIQDGSLYSVLMGVWEHTMPTHTEKA